MLTEEEQEHNNIQCIIEKFTLSNSRYTFFFITYMYMDIKYEILLFTTEINRIN